MKQVILKVVILFVAIFSLANLIPLLPNDFYKKLTVFVLFHALTIGLIVFHLKKANSLRIYGMYLVAITLIYGYVNYTDNGLLFYVLTGGGINFKSIWLILLLTTLLSIGIYGLAKGGRLFPVSANRIIVVSLLLLLAYLVTELPVYHRYSYDHGHSFWRGGHLH